MKTIKYIFFVSILLILNSCITKFIPDTNENQELLVVEGLITDQPGANTIKISKSLPLGSKNMSTPVSGCTVSISDDAQNSYSLSETTAGKYVTTQQFIGSVGHKYTLHIKTNSSFKNSYSFESYPMEMKPVPVIDSVYYERKTIKPTDGVSASADGCQVYLNTHDPTGVCKYFRWDYNETWEFHLPFARALNPVCWISDVSGSISIKNTKILAEDVVSRFPLAFISNESDRLKIKYSMMVNQYSMNEDEYNYWEKLKNITQDIGSLYDITPASIPSNIYCIENPGEKVLGYFSVSAKSSKRFLIKDNFRGIVNLYTNCIADSIYSASPPYIVNLNMTTWILDQNLPPSMPPYFTTITYFRGCADCTARGTNIEPDFMKDNN